MWLTTALKSLRSPSTAHRRTHPSLSRLGQTVRRDGTRPGFWDVRPTRADRSTATKLRVLTPLKDGSAVYLRYPWDRSEKPLPKFQVLRPLHFPLPTVPHRPTGGTIAIRPTFRITYSLRDRPDGTPRARDRLLQLTDSVKKADKESRGTSDHFLKVSRPENDGNKCYQGTLTCFVHFDPI